jgi:hypothetical protein
VYIKREFPGKCPLLSSSGNAHKRKLLFNSVKSGNITFHYSCLVRNTRSSRLWVVL